MIDLGKRNLLGVLVDAVDYEAATERILAAARTGRPFAASALAVHGVMTGYTDPEHRSRLNQFDLVTPDGQPVRWALNLLHGVGLRDRVYGPNLTLKVCEEVDREGLGVYFYGSTQPTLDRLTVRLQELFPSLRICGFEPSKFRNLTVEEKHETAARIRASGAKLTFVGLGCPRQEVWAYEYRDLLSMPVLAVGAAFDFHAGTVSQAPPWMQARGLEWLYRLRVEPGRLWRRYLLLNPWYVVLVAAQRLGLRSFTARARMPITEISHG